jgi:branched-chain amino acid transport system permease protein
MRSRYAPILFFSAAVIAVQLLTVALDRQQYLTQLTMTGYYSLVIVGLCMLMGYAGQISLGHAGFFAIGGYVSAFLTTYDLMQHKANPLIGLFSGAGLTVTVQDLYGGDALVFHPWAACIAAILVTVLIAYVIGGPVLKLKGHYLAMATLGFGTIVYKIVLGTSFFGAADGLSDIPGFKVLPGLEVSGKTSLRIQNYYISWGMVVLGMLLLANLIHSRAGKALRAIHSAEDAANAMGVNTARYKLNIFVLSAVFAAAGGVFLTHYNGGIGPSEASIMKSVRYVAIVAIGGMANLWGALSMGIVLNFLSLRGYFGSYDDAVFGVILILIMLFAPEGLLRREVFRGAKKWISGRGKAEGQRT